MSYRLLIKLAALASTCWIGVSHALAESRMALVIGNSHYTSVAALPNPANDAKAVARFLTSAGFQVLQAPDLAQADMRRTIGNFAGMVAEKGPDTVALVFYAGHGLQVDGENYLVPVDASIQREADVPLQAMRLADLMNALATVPSKTRIVILDACRNNPFSEINKTTGRGLAIVDAPTGSLVSYSTAPGTEAQDGDGLNSPFTTALLKVAQTPNLPVEQMFKRIRLAVTESTNRQQIPWESSSLTSDFSFFSGGNVTPASAPGASTLASPSPSGTSAPARTETRSVDSWQKELKSHSPREAYEIVIREDKVEAYQAYLALYPNQSLAPAMRTIVERRREMIAWYTAVTVNTTASYQTFLAAHPGSDFVMTANRLSERIRFRSVSNAANAFASVGPTCPCSQPAPALTPRQKRADVAPSGPASSASATSGSAGGVAVVSKPVVKEVIEEPPPRVRVDWPHRHVHHDDGPKRPVHNPDPPSRSVDKGSKANWGKTTHTATVVTRGSGFNRGMSYGRPMGRPMFRAGFMGGRRFF